ncbi:MAG: NosD domain-containing protein [Candidatus Marinimicrobia bacterium]|nr:NosD domain-containing protein [Candidatus Neomarinimicrobiota bacterium]
MSYSLIFSFTPDPEDGHSWSYINDTGIMIDHLVEDGDGRKIYFFVKSKNEMGVISNPSGPDSTILNYDIPEAPHIDPIPPVTDADSIRIVFHDNVPTNSLTGVRHQLRYADNREFNNDTRINLGDASEAVFRFRSSDHRLYFQIRGLHAGYTGEWSEMVYTTYSPPAGKRDVYYVSPAGSDAVTPNMAMDPATPFRSIQKAYHTALAGDTIKVMDDDDTTSCDYWENLDITKPVAIVAYDKDGTAPVVSYHANYIMRISSDNVHISGLRIDPDRFEVQGVTIENSGSCSIEGNTFLNTSLKLLSADHSHIRDNRFISSGDGRESCVILENSEYNKIYDNRFSGKTGVDILMSSYNDIFRNTFSGVYIWYNVSLGIRASRVKHSLYNNIYDNQFLYGTDLVVNRSAANNIFRNFFKTWNYGLKIIESGYNTLTENTFYRGTRGLILDHTQYNNISGNTFSLHVQDAPLLLSNASKNIITANGYSELELKPKIEFREESNGNTVFYNRFYYGNEWPPGSYGYDPILESENSGDNIFHSPNEITHYYGNRRYTSKDTLYNDTGDDDQIIDIRPEAWWLGKGTLYKNDMSQPGQLIHIAAGDSYLWTSDASAAEDMRFENLSWEKKRWNGCLNFKSTLNSGDSIVVTLGSAADPLGNGFTAKGPSSLLSADDSLRQVLFVMHAKTFTLEQGEYLAVRIRNHGSSDLDLMTGGSWSYIAPPVSNQPPKCGSPRFYVDEDDTLAVSAEIFYDYINDPDNADSLLSFHIPDDSHVTVQQSAHTVRFIPAADRDRDSKLVWTVSDGELTEQNDILLNINPVNDPPVIDSLPNIVYRDGYGSAVNSISRQSLLECVRDIDTPDENIRVTLQSDEVWFSGGESWTYKPPFIISNEYEWKNQPALFIVSDGEYFDTAGIVIRVDEKNEYVPKVNRHMKFYEDDTLSPSYSKNITDVAAYLNDCDMFDAFTRELIRPDSVINIDTSVNAVRDTAFNLIFSTVSRNGNLRFELIDGDPYVYSMEENYFGWDSLDVQIYDHYGPPYYHVSTTVPVYVIPVNDPPVIANLPVLEWAEDDTLDNVAISDFYACFSDDNPLEDIPLFILEGNHTRVYSDWTGSYTLPESTYRFG